jgi:hypothetical protein
MRVPVLAGLVAALLSGLPAERLGAASTATEPADLPGLVAAAERICEIQVLEARCARLPDGLIESVYTVSTLSPLKGAAAAIEEIRMPGGEVAGRGLLVPGLPRLRVGQRAILFLSAESPTRGWRLPVGLGAGAYEVIADPLGAPARVTGMGTEGADPRVLEHAVFLAAIQAEIARQAHAR